jgi:DNA polymerase III sliding clamp (beta) subunit (PCNA family)
MKATVDYHEFMTVIAALDQAAEYDNSGSVFGFVRFTVEGAKLKIDAYDGADGVHVTLEADEVYALEDGSAIVQLRELVPILRQIKACAIVRIEAAAGEVWMHFEKLSYKFEEPHERLYQFVGKIEKVFKKREGMVGFFADATSLKHDISCVKSAMADWERRTLAGVHCEMEGDSVRLVATNGKVLVERSHVADNLEKQPEGFGFIPWQFVRMLEVLLQEFSFKAHVGFDRDGGRVDIGGVVSLVWEFESAFPEWRCVMPTTKPVDSIEIMNVREVVNALATVNRTWDRVEDEDGEMDTGCQDECVLATDGKGGMVITGDVDVSHRCIVGGVIKGHWSIPVDCYGGDKEPIVIKFNPNYLRACLENFADQHSVVMEYRGINEPVKFCGTRSSAAVMPYRD